MKLSQLIKICGELLNLDIPSGAFSLPQTPSDSRVERLLAGFAQVYEEIYRDYASALCKTVVTSANGKADLSPYKLCRVVSLVDGEGRNVPFRYGEQCLYVKQDGSFNMCYARLPDDVDWNDEVTMPSPRITARILAYGVAREYHTTLGDWQEAKQWDERFKNAIQATCGKSSSMRMPARGWL